MRKQQWFPLTHPQSPPTLFPASMTKQKLNQPYSPLTQKKAQSYVAVHRLNPKTIYTNLIDHQHIPPANRSNMVSETILQFTYTTQRAKSTGKKLCIRPTHEKRSNSTLQASVTIKKTQAQHRHQQP